jgi:hypothetical protein
VEFFGEDAKEAHELASRDVYEAHIQTSTRTALTERFNQVGGFFGSVRNALFDLANSAFHASAPARETIGKQLLVAYDQSKSVLVEAAGSTLIAAHSIAKPYLPTTEASPVAIEMNTIGARSSATLTT